MSDSRRRRVGNLSLIVLCASVPLWLSNSAYAAPLIDLSSGDLHFTLSSGRAAVLTVRGVDVYRESGLYIVKPGWTHAMLNLDKMTPMVSVSKVNGAEVATAEYVSNEARATYRYEMAPDTFKVSLTYSTTVQPALVEYDAAYVNANVISGTQFHARTISFDRFGRVAAFTNTSDQFKNRVCPFFTKMTFDSRIGPMSISVNGNTSETSNLNMFDARGITLEWGAKNPIFWLGLGSPERSVPPGDNTITITWKFGHPATRVQAAPVATNVVDVKDALPPPPELPIIPRPKAMKVGPPSARVRVAANRTRILIEERASPEMRAAARELQAEFRNVWGLELPIKVLDFAKWSSHPEGPAIWILSKRHVAIIGKDSGAASAHSARAALKRAEGYCLESATDGATVIGADDRGTYYGVQTLKQLIRQDAQGVYINPVEICDWPTMEFRGVHWFGGPKSWPFHQRMIDRIAAPLKLNKMVYEVEYSQWESQPGIWVPTRSTPKDRVRKTVAEARAHFIEPIPLIPTLGHTNWLFENGQNLDFAADRKDGHAYDPTMEESYAALFGVMQEAIDIFHPKWFHIGHDEVTTYGDYLPPAKVTELFVNDVQKIHAWLKQKGIGTMVWGDELLHSSETLSSGNAYTLVDAKARRAGMPKDVVIADWHYRGDADYPSVVTFQKEGHKVIGCTWSEPANIRNFSKSLADQKAWGLLQTTWDGYAMSLERVNGDSLKQYAAYVLAAEYAWNGGDPSLGKLGYNPMDAFLAFWERKPLDTTPRPGWHVEFRVPSSEFCASKPGTRNSELRAALAGRLSDTDNPISLTIPLKGRRAKDIRFVWGTDYSAPVGTRVATLTVAYVDGSSADVPISYGKQIAAFNDLRTRAGTTGVWSGESKYGELRERRAWTWSNPNPTKPLKSLTITSANTEAAPVLLSITGISK